MGCNLTKREELESVVEHKHECAREGMKAVIRIVRQITDDTDVEHDYLIQRIKQLVQEIHHDAKLQAFAIAALDRLTTEQLDEAYNPVFSNAGGYR